MISNAYPKDESIKYPCLMKNKHQNLIVFFRSKNDGMVVWIDKTDNCNENLGTVRKNWDMTNFSFYNGEVSLKNS